MRVSVILSTYDRAETLRETLKSICEMTTPPSLQWELLVIDNGSTDHTRQVCDSFLGELPIRYLFDGPPGKCRALNNGIQSARYELIVFTDDDVNVDQHWLPNYAAAADRHPDVGLFVGRVLPKWEAPPPKWIEDNLNTMSFLCHLDRGDLEGVLPREDPARPVGANMAVRTVCFQQGVSYPESIGATGRTHTVSAHVGGEEGEIARQVVERGWYCAYTPTAVVYHRHTRDRMTERYLRRWAMGHEIGDVRLGRATQKNPWFGVPAWYWRQFAINSTRYVLTRWTRNSDVWLPAEIRMASAWGAICEFRRLQKTNSSRRKVTSVPTCLCW